MSFDRFRNTLCIVHVLLELIFEELFYTSTTRPHSLVLEDITVSGTKIWILFSSGENNISWMSTAIAQEKSRFAWLRPFVIGPHCLARLQPWCFVALDFIRVHDCVHFIFFVCTVSPSVSLQTAVPQSLWHQWRCQVTWLFCLFIVTGLSWQCDGPQMARMPHVWTVPPDRDSESDNDRSLQTFH